LAYWRSIFVPEKGPTYNIEGKLEDEEETPQSLVLEYLTDA